MELAILEGSSRDDLYTAYSKLGPNEKAELLGRTFFGRMARKTKNLSRQVGNITDNKFINAGLSFVPGYSALKSTANLTSSSARTFSSLVPRPTISRTAAGQVATIQPAAARSLMRKAADGVKFAKLQEKSKAEQILDDIAQKAKEKLEAMTPEVKTKTQLDLSSLKIPALIGTGVLAVALLKR